MAIDKYDEYARGVQREVITIDTKINKTNKGFAMLAKLGWVEGQPLGISGNGLSYVRYHEATFAHLSIQVASTRSRL